MQFDLSTADEIAEQFGERLRAHRLAQNLQQSELAARAGISERCLSNFERSGRGTFDVFLRIVMALGLVGAVETLFEVRPQSIRAMEEASIRRKRASKRTRRQDEKA
jgi:transcriptional regulator with XRE-family HTH domain